MPPFTYAADADKMTKLILSLIPEHPEILKFDSPWALFHLDNFKRDFDALDLSVSLFQACYALESAIKLYKEQHNEQILQA